MGLDQGQLILYSLNNTPDLPMASSETFLVCQRSSSLIETSKVPCMKLTLSLIILSTNIAKELDGLSLSNLS